MSQSGSKAVSRAFVVLGAILAGVIMLAWNFGNTYEQRQESFANAVVSRGVGVVNNLADTQFGQSGESVSRPADDSDLAFGTAQIKAISRVPGVEETYPYYYFSSNGVTAANATENSSVSIQTKDKQTVFSKVYQNLDAATSTGSSTSHDSFVIDEFYPQDAGFFPKTGLSNPIYLTDSFAKLSHAKLGQQLTISFFIPIILTN